MFSKSESQFSAVTSQASQATYSIFDRIAESILLEATIENKMATLSNVHATLHFSTLITKYELL